MLFTMRGKIKCRHLNCLVIWNIIGQMPFFLLCTNGNSCFASSSETKRLPPNCLLSVSLSPQCLSNFHSDKMAATWWDVNSNAKGKRQRMSFKGLCFIPQVPHSSPALGHSGFQTGSVSMKSVTCHPASSHQTSYQWCKVPTEPQHLNAKCLNCPTF